MHARLRKQCSGTTPGSARRTASRVFPKSDQLLSRSPNICRLRVEVGRIGPKSVYLGHMCRYLGKHRPVPPHLARASTEYGPISSCWAMFDHVRPKSARVGQTRPTCARNRPHLARTPPDLAHTERISAKRRPDTRPNLAQAVDQISLARFGTFGPAFDQVWAELCRMRPTSRSARFRPKNWPDFGQTWAAHRSWSSD